MTVTPTHRAFTLIEMLVVIAIITLLLALIQPSMRQSKEAARDVQCRSDFHQIGNAFLALSVDNRDRLPGLWGPPWTGPTDIEWSFLGKEVFTGPYQPVPAQKPGALLGYLAGEASARQLYRCPSLPVGTFGSGVGSNGYFDYTMFQCLPGARVTTLPKEAIYIDPLSGDDVTVPFPVIIEEHPSFGINKNFIDCGHTSINRFATSHLGGSGNYVSADGSGQHLTFGTATGPEGWAWSANRGGIMTNMGTMQPYGGWDK